MVALVGRPNVGKSTLFNRIVGKRLAVVSEKAGTTRDRIQAEAEWNGITFTVVDTGGIEVESGFHTEPLSEDSVLFLPAIRSQATVAIDAADLVVLIVDAQVGPTAADEEVAKILRKSTRPVIVAANKAESVTDRNSSFEFYSLGLGEVVAISALHGIGTGDLLDLVIEAFPEQDEEEDEELDQSVKIAIVGRPNVGKSSLLNKLLGKERAIVSSIAGTTRDSIDTHLEWENTPITLIDTAGIRRRGKIDPGIEKYSVLRALRSIKRADVALLLLDAEQGVTSQDEHIAGFILEENTSVVLLVNKWDAVEKDTFTINEYTKKLQSDLNFMEYVPVLFISALTGQRVHTVLPTALDVYSGRQVRIPTSDLNKLIRDAVSRHSPPSKSGKRLRFLYATQASIDPPTIVFFVNDPELVHFSYRRYLENQIRREYPFPGTPLVMRFRSREGEE